MNDHSRTDDPLNPLLAEVLDQCGVKPAKGHKHGGKVAKVEHNHPGDTDLFDAPGE